MKVQLAEYKQMIAALRPVYTAAGDGTDVILINGDVLHDRRRIRSVRQALARVYAVDLVAARQYYRKLLGQANAIPLPLSAKLILCPTKMRRPRCPGDFTLGYVSYRQVVGVEGYSKGDYRSRVLLRNGAILLSLNRVTILKKRLALARFVEGHYLEAQGLMAQGASYGLATREAFVLLETKLDLLLERMGAQ
ncbi:MAG: hypothetical protein GX376_05645 [Firmicutes bacterium]|nr:hypothetical protein [Bacillota bacterium]